MGIFYHKQYFCTVCKKSISHKNKPKREWNVEGPLCLNCYMIEMKKQYGIKDETISDSKTQQKSKSGARVTENSPKIIRFQYYSTIFLFIISPISIISGLTTGNTFSLVSGIVMLVIALIQYPKLKKQRDRISKTEDDPLTFLKMRLAKGEITMEEFVELRKKIE